MVHRMRAGMVLVGLLASCAIPARPAAADEVLFKRAVSPTTGYTAMSDRRVYPTDTASATANFSVIYLNYPTGGRLLSYFDVSAIPTGSIISQATLEYDLYNGQYIQATLGVYRVTTNWLAGQRWITKGGDWVDSQGASQGTVPVHAIFANYNGWYTWDVTPIVQAWVSGAAPNYGLIVVTGPGAATYGQAYGSGHSSTGVRPQLRITYVPGGSDSTPPVISQVAAGDVTDLVATITWSTDEPATSQVAYGTTPALGQMSPLNGTLTTTHSVQLTGLIPGTSYSYQVQSQDASGNAASGAIAEFVTAAPPDTVAPTGSITIVQAPLTNSQTVTLSLSAQDTAGLVPSMRLANTAADVATAAEEAFAASRSWQLSAGDGPKTVSVHFKDAAGNWSTTYSADTTVDTVKPMLQILTPLDGAIIVAPN